MSNVPRLTPGPEQGGYILIAMPNPTRAGAFRAELASLNIETVLVPDGERAKEALARRGPPTLTIVDLSLPKIDGFELLRELRKQAQPSEAAAIVLSGHSAVRLAAQRLADSLGISKVLPFDVDRPALRETVETTLRQMTSPEVARAIQPRQTGEAAAGLAEKAIDTAILAAVRRFRTAITLVYVNRSGGESVRGYFALSEPLGTVSIDDILSLLRQVASTSEPLIVPDVVNYAAVNEIAAGGANFFRGFAAIPLPLRSADTSGALCVFDTKPLTVDATELDALDALARGLARDLEDGPSLRINPERSEGSRRPGRR